MELLWSGLSSGLISVSGLLHRMLHKDVLFQDPYQFWLFWLVPLGNSWILFSQTQVKLKKMEFDFVHAFWDGS